MTSLYSVHFSIFPSPLHPYYLSFIISSHLHFPYISILYLSSLVFPSFILSILSLFFFYLRTRVETMLVSWHKMRLSVFSWLDFLVNYSFQSLIYFFSTNITVLSFPLIYNILSISTLHLYSLKFPPFITSLFITISLFTKAMLAS